MIGADLNTYNTCVTYTISKVDDTAMFIYKKGIYGCVRYKYGRQVDAGIRLDTYRLLTIDFCDVNKNVIHNISKIGADLEGVVLLNGETDHIGGVHGDEIATDFYIFVDGKFTTFANITETECNEIKFIVKSDITHQDSETVCMEKTKQTTFNKDGVHIRCFWRALEVLSICSIRSCMMSVQKEGITHYYDSNVNRIPIKVPEIAKEGTVLSDDVNIVDIYYLGDFTCHHWAGVRGGNTANYSTIILDYGPRLKSYFNCYDNYTATVDEELMAENHFFILC